jgi:DNA-binding NarL/FixJ family response regulator
MKTRIYVVDDHALFRKGLSVLINAEPDLEVVGESDDCGAGTSNILKIKPDLVIVDISVRGDNGLELVKNIKAIEPDIQIVVLSQHDESVYALRVLRAGAQAYVMKQDAATAVLDAIRSIRKGQLYVSENIASQMLRHFAHGESLRDDSPVAGLSDRELEVLNLIGSGMPTREIAQRLHLSVKTVETHRAHIKTKLHLATSSQLVQFGVRWVDRNEHVPRRGVAVPGAETANASELAAPVASTGGALRERPAPRVPAARYRSGASFPGTA